MNDKPASASANILVLQAQQTFPAETWYQIKDNVDALGGVIKAQMVRQIAAALIEKSAVRFVVNEPQKDAADAYFAKAVVECAVTIVADKGQTARYALQLNEAERRGFYKALAAIKSQFEFIAPSLGKDAYARGRLERVVAATESGFDHHETGGWLPMSSVDRYRGQIEYLFETGDVHSSPLIRKPKSKPLWISFEPPSEKLEDHEAETLHAIAWRVQGRPEYRERVA